MFAAAVGIEMMSGTEPATATASRIVRGAAMIGTAIVTAIEGGIDIDLPRPQRETARHHRARDKSG